MSTLGILAGHGDLPQQLAEACRAQKRPYFILAFEGQTEESLVSHHPHKWVKLGAVGDAIKSLKGANVTQIVMAGYFHRPNFAQLKPDFKGAFWLARILKNKAGDDGILRIIAEELEKEGFKVIGTEDILQTQNFATPGMMGTLAPTKDELNTIQRGVKVLQALGDQDVGQAIVVQNATILGIEAIEGTDALIQRTTTYKLDDPQKPILIKLMKSTQDQRLDQPTVGLDTIEKITQAGFAGIALQADKVIMLKKEELIEKANKTGLFVYGI